MKQPIADYSVATTHMHCSFSFCFPFAYQWVHRSLLMYSWIFGPPVQSTCKLPTIFTHWTMKTLPLSPYLQHQTQTWPRYISCVCVVDQSQSFLLTYSHFNPVENISYIYALVYTWPEWVFSPSFSWNAKKKCF